MSEANNPAYPVTPQVMTDAHSGGSWEMASLGFTKRERFAMAAMQGLIARGESVEAVESLAKDYADVVLKSLEKEPK